MAVLASFVVPHPPIIFPEIGRGEEIRINKTTGSYRQVSGRIAELEPDTIVLASPHSVMYSDYFHISPGEGPAATCGSSGPRGCRFTRI
jgi:aromatic ring-opening dioxygenase LigB subunit